MLNLRSTPIITGSQHDSATLDPIPQLSGGDWPPIACAECNGRGYTIQHWTDENGGPDYVLRVTCRCQEAA